MTKLVRKDAKIESVITVPGTTSLVQGDSVLILKEICANPTRIFELDGGSQEMIPVWLQDNKPGQICVGCASTSNTIYRSIKCGKGFIKKIICNGTHTVPGNPAASQMCTVEGNTKTIFVKD